MFLTLAGLPVENPAMAMATNRLHASIAHADEHLKNNKWLAGEDFAAADVINVYGLTTQRYWWPNVSLAEYPNVLRWLRDVGARPGYRRAMEKGDPEMEPLLGAEALTMTLMQNEGLGRGSGRGRGCRRVVFV
ncbi:glutathione S-transferase [Bimuria novae-zelandiae CBS 107.79]|uniref:Glutathione S-transferase n=1 Tax=Bimuria novae-zelandiae CBS 107.79 TaxID=1447943 RepID=A0A6A5VQI5_9PLEO|nr:glutathione S-transferase [Bimuria novae-zelandiae CBS 107.79]